MDPATRERLDALEKRLERHEDICQWMRNITWLAMIGIIGFLAVKWVEGEKQTPQPWYEQDRR